MQHPFNFASSSLCFAFFLFVSPFTVLSIDFAFAASFQIQRRLATALLFMSIWSGLVSEWSWSGHPGNVKYLFLLSGRFF